MTNTGLTSEIEMTSVQITEARLNGLRYVAAKEQAKQGRKAKVHVYGVLDDILANAGIENLTDDQMKARIEALLKEQEAQ